MNIERERFEAWLFSQPKERRFDWSDVRGCAVCAFLNETQKLRASSGGNHSNLWSGTVHVSDWVKRVEWPMWLEMVVKNNLIDLTIGNMQRKYLELFPDTHLEPVQPHPTSMSESRKVR